MVPNKICRYLGQYGLDTNLGSYNEDYLITIFSKKTWNIRPNITMRIEAYMFHQGLFENPFRVYGGYLRYIEKG